MEPLTVQQREALQRERVLAALSNTPRLLPAIFTIAEDLTIGLDESTIISVLFLLEMQGRAEQLPGKRFRRIG
jgi:hypothetical protein